MEKENDVVEEKENIEDLFGQFIESIKNLSQEELDQLYKNLKDQE